MPGNQLHSINRPSLQAIRHPVLDDLDLSVSILRLDLIHPELGGNKWFKLKQNLAYIEEHKIEQVLSFGGAWSNHLLALAAAGKQFNFKTYGVIRGENLDPPSPVIRRLQELGMSLLPISREKYRNKTDSGFLQSLERKIGSFYCLPEGGTNHLAIKGCMELSDFLKWKNQDSEKMVAGACGTGGMLSGLILGLEQQDPTTALPKVMGISVLKATNYLSKEVAGWLQEFGSSGIVNWQVMESYHCGGYAKSSTDLEQFLACFRKAFEIPIEPVYTGKLAYGLWSEIQAGRVEAGSEIIAIHSGGILNRTN